MNLKQLSDLLGISQTTISRALNGYPEVNKDTRKRVEEAAKKYGYAPSSVARRLAGKRVDAVGIIQSSESCMSSPFIFLEMVGVISARLHQGKIDLFVVPSAGNQELELYKRMITGGRVDSFIVEATRRVDKRIEWLMESNIPFVSFGRSQVQGNYSWLDVDHRGGIKKACDALVELGHRRIAYFHQRGDLNYSCERLMGFNESVKEHELSEPVIRDDCVSEDSAYQMSLQLLSLPESTRPSAIVCTSMHCVKGVIKAIEAKGLCVGDDVSVITWDDGIQELSVPAVSVISAPLRNSCVRVAELLLELIHSDKKETFQEMQGVELVLTASVGPCKAFVC